MEEKRYYLSRTTRGRYLMPIDPSKIVLIEETFEWKDLDGDDYAVLEWIDEKILMTFKDTKISVLKKDFRFYRKEIQKWDFGIEEKWYFKFNYDVVGFKLKWT